MRLADKVAVVTGSGQGIGKAMVVRMAKEGASVVVTGLDGGKIKSVVDEIRASGGKAIGVQADVTQRPQVRHLTETALKEYGHIDILVNNAVARRRSPSFFDMT